MATEAPAVTHAPMTREATIAQLRRRLGLDLAWDAATDDELTILLADLAGADDRLAAWEPAIERRVEGG